MATKKVDIAGTNIAASQMSEFFRLAAMSGNHINRETFQAYITRQPLFANEAMEQMIRLAGIIDKVRYESGVSEKDFELLWTPEGRPHIVRMFESLRQHLSDPYSVLTETEILKPDGSITFPERTTPIDPNEFFNRSNVFLGVLFQERILPVLRPVARTPERTYMVGRLKKRTSIHEIRSDLPKCHLGNWEDIASLIEMYPNGKEGYYLLYLEGVGGGVFAVNVRWLSGHRGWDVGGWLLVELGKWFAACQVLCPGNAVL